jgi:hypothetical protein
MHTQACLNAFPIKNPGIASTEVFDIDQNTQKYVDQALI